MATFWKVNAKLRQKFIKNTAENDVDHNSNDIYSLFAVYSNRHNLCFGPVLVWLVWKTSNWKVSNHTRVSGVFSCLVHTV